VVIALTGFLLSTNVRVNRTVAVTNDTADLVEQGVDEVNQISRIVGDGNRTIDPHVGAQQKTGQGNDDEYRDTTP
ncbi:hypothetical protein BLOI2_1419, partial [Bifidobacterium longum subsp. longum]